MNRKISIIVPVFNVEKYLSRCIDSLLAQTYSNIEILLIDDGSTDNSSDICDEYADKYVNVCVYHKINGGLSDARNYGIQRATGEYINFVDSDDWIDDDYITNLYEAMNKTGSQLAVSRLKKTSSKKKPVKKKKYRIYESRSGLSKIFYQKKYDTSASGKLFRISDFVDNNIFFPKGLLYEDLATIYKVFLKIEKVVFVNSEDYHYFDERKGSIINTEFNDKNLDITDISDQIYFDINEYEIDKKRRDLLNSAVCRIISALASVYRMIPSNSLYMDQKKFLKSKLVTYSSLVKLSFRMRIKNYIYIFFLKYLN